jgi:hypothetical protein
LARKHPHSSFSNISLRKSQANNPGRGKNISLWLRNRESQKARGTKAGVLTETPEKVTMKLGRIRDKEMDKNPVIIVK